MTEDGAGTRWELLIQINREVAAALDLGTVLQRLAFATLQHAGAERASIVVLDDAGQPADAIIVLGKNVHDHATQQLAETVDRGLAGWAIRHRQPVLVPDTSKDERWLRRPDDAVERTGPKSALAVPLVARESVVGVLTLVHSTPNALGPAHLELTQAIADQASIAVLNARLFEQLGHAHRHYQELFEESIDPIIITDREGRIAEANRAAAFLSGFTSQQLRSMGIDQLHELNWDKAVAAFESLRDTGRKSYESVLLRADGGKVPVEVHARRVEVGAAGAIQWTLRDVSERKDLDALREDLTAMIYHDLRSPLANIVSSLDVLNGIVDEDGVGRSMLDVATHSTDRIQRLIDSLLDIHRLESGQPITTQTEASPEELIQRAVQDVAASAEGRRQTIQTRLADRLPSLWVDGEMVGRVLINLLENAIKFSGAESEIEVGARTDARNVQFWVTDHGPGIPSYERERIFEKFRRLKDRSGRSGGLGIGLAFCRLAVQAHGGTIRVESEEGKGSTFLFTLPTKDQPV